MDITLNEVIFSLPCKTFFVDYSVSKKRTLPVVKEFVIRYIFTLESVSANTLTNFFGFNSHELMNVLEDLKEESLIVWHEDEIRLSRYALDRFEEAGNDGVPRFFEVTDEFATVTFDLMSYRLITKRTEAHNSPNAIEVSLKEDAYKSPAVKASRAFNDQFGTFLEDQLQIDPLNDWRDLYKINSVTPRDDKMLPLRIKLFIDTDAANGLCVEYADDWLVDWDKSGGILGEVQRSLSERPSAKRLKISEIETYCDITEDPNLREFINGESLDIDFLLKSITGFSGLIDPNTRLIVGNLYLQENVILFHSMLDEIVGEDSKVQSRGAIWSIDPDRKMWGRSSDMAYFANQVKSRFDERFKPGNISLCLCTPSHYIAKNYRDQYWRTEAAFQGVNSTFGGSQTELFLIPETILVSIFHISDDRFGNQTIPIGYVTTDSNRINRVGNRFAEWISGEQVRNKFFETHRDSEETVFQKVTKKILQIS